MLKIYILFLIFSCICIQADASLTVIYNDGETISSAPYIRDIHYPHKGQAISMLLQHKDLYREKNIELHNLIYPIKSDLREGKVYSHELTTKGLVRPLYVVGDDPVSINWAISNAVDLKRLNAIGIITNVASQSRVKTIERETGLTLIPAQLNGISKYTHVSYYPFLWTKDDIEQ